MENARDAIGDVHAAAEGVVAGKVQEAGSKLVDEARPLDARRDRAIDIVSAGRQRVARVSTVSSATPARATYEAETVARISVLETTSPSSGASFQRTREAGVKPWPLTITVKLDHPAWIDAGSRLVISKDPGSSETRTSTDDAFPPALAAMRATPSAFPVTQPSDATEATSVRSLVHWKA
jgi:hypothetical protein